MRILYRYDATNGLYLDSFHVEDDAEVPIGATDIAPDFDMDFDPETHYARFYMTFWMLFEKSPAAQPVEPAPVTSDMIAARRYAAETLGIVIDGMVVATDDRSQALITGAALQALIDPEYSLQWKTAAGFVQLTGQQILALASAVRAHVQACFDREAELLAALADGSIAIDLLEQGWPA